VAYQEIGIHEENQREEGHIQQDDWMTEEREDHKEAVCNTGGHHVSFSFRSREGGVLPVFLRLPTATDRSKAQIIGPCSLDVLNGRVICVLCLGEEEKKENRSGERQDRHDPFHPSPSETPASCQKRSALSPRPFSRTYWS
jgi:hypothetical protein